MLREEGEEGRKGRRDGGGGGGVWGGGGKEGEEGEEGEGEIVWMRVENFVGSSPSRFHGTDFLYHSSGGKGEQLSPTSALLLFYCFRLSPGLPFLLGPAPITSEVREELEKSKYQTNNDVNKCKLSSIYLYRSRGTLK
jgi:hypothetical protein